MNKKPEGPYSFVSFVNFVNQNFSLLLLGSLIFLSGFMIGSLWTENQMLKKGVVSNPNQAAQAPSAVEEHGPTQEQLASVPEVTEDDHIRGDIKAKVTLIEYSDFECPYCGSFHPTMTKVMEEYGDKVAWVYRHYPLPFHPNADPAAKVSECVNKIKGQDAFWQFADAVYKVNGEKGTLSKEDITVAAQNVGLSGTQIEDCLVSNEFTEIIKAHMDGGSQAGVSGTPGTILKTSDGQYELISGALGYDQIKTTIDKYL